MDEKTISEPKEGALVLIAEISAAVTGFLSAVPLPNEWKLSAVALAGAVTTAISGYWYAKINKKKAEA